MWYLIAGPMVGGSLYQLGGYFLPFGTLGSLLFITAIITFCILPKDNVPIRQENSNGKILFSEQKKQQTNKPNLNLIVNSICAVSMKSLLKIPGIIVCSMSIVATSASIGFLAATLEPHLRQFDLSPVLLGKTSNQLVIDQFHIKSFSISLHRCRIHYSRRIVCDNGTHLGLHDW